MEQKILSFIEKHNLSPFNQNKTQLKQSRSIYKTKDAKSIHTKTLNTINKYFQFKDTQNILHFFSSTNNLEEIKIRQEFFKKIKLETRLKNEFLNQIKKPKKFWKPEYDITAVTEDPETFTKLKELDIPVQLIISEQDLPLLESKDIIQIINCPEYQIALESLPQAIFFKDINQIYLERHLETLSGWTNTINILKQNSPSNQINQIIDFLAPLTKLIEDQNSTIIDPDTIEDKVFYANQKIEEKLKSLTLSGESLMSILSKGILPENIKQLIEATIAELKIPRNILEIQIPLKIDEYELSKLIDEQSKNKFSKSAEKIKEYSDQLKRIPEKLKKLKSLLLLYDFKSGISNFINNQMQFPKISDNLILENAKNLLIENPQPISFNLSKQIKCSILTGANSGGKTTLLEHLIQIISLSQIGLPLYGKITTPLFEEIYYFAKNKGSTQKGAFETLLAQMSKINPGNKTLILADEIESVTEPGAAGIIIAATAKYFINKNCYLVIATHLGHEIKNILPEKSRIDGIEAKGLTEDFKLIIDHNPVIGKLANSTPELIIKKLANTQKKQYFTFLNNFLNSNKDQYNSS